jgi:hypothetical protein
VSVHKEVESNQSVGTFSLNALNLL